MLLGKGPASCKKHPKSHPGLCWRAQIIPVGDQFTSHLFLMSYRHPPLQHVGSEPKSALFLIFSHFLLPMGSFFLCLVGSCLSCIHILQPKIALIFFIKTLHRKLFSRDIHQSRAQFLYRNLFPSYLQYSCFRGLYVLGDHPVCHLLLGFFSSMSFCFRILHT